MKGDTLENLRRVAGLEVEAAGACSAQLGRVDVDSMVDRILELKQDHLKHVDRLNVFLGRESEAISIPADVRTLLEGDFRHMTMPETGPALISIQAGEEALIEAYDETIEATSGTDRDLKDALVQMRSDLQRHLAWLTDTLDRGWIEPENVGASS